MFAGIPSEFADSPYRARIGPDSERWSSFEESIVAIDDCWVEPSRCYIIGLDGRLVQQSRAHASMFPSAWAYNQRGSGRYVPEAVVYDGFYSTNYYHHLIDVLPNLLMLFERSDLPPYLPLIVNRWIYESRFFAYLRQRSQEFAGLNWIVQEPGQWLRVGRAYRLNAAPFSRGAFAKIRTMYGRLGRKRGRKVFLSRDSKKFSRGIVNEAAVVTLLAHYGFETVYAEHMTLEEQQRTFEECSHLVALQGMGLAQQLFMDPTTGHVLELMPCDRIQTEYYWQGWTLGMRFYDVLTGSAMDRRGMYRIGLESLETRLRRMLDHPADQWRYGETLIVEA